MTNIKTTLAGLIPGLLIGGQALLEAYEKGQFEGKTGVQLAIALGFVLLGAYSKDHDVTGGKIQQ